MSRALRRLGGWRFFLCLVLLWAACLPLAQAAEMPARGELQVFVREGCPHCAEAKAFLAGLAPTRPDISIVYLQVDRDRAARDALIEISRAAGSWPPGVPTFVFRDQVLVGFDDGEHRGKELVALLGEPPKSRNTVESSLFGTLSASEMGLPLFTLTLGLLDGFNPCAMALVAGTFVLASGAVYYAFMAAWLNVFLFVGMTDALRVGLAGLAMLIGFINVKDFVAFGRGVSLSIPEAAKPGIYARVRAILKAESLPASLAAVAVLAVLVNFVELLCTAGLPAIYTAVLTQHDLSALAHYGYLGLYILAYIADDALMVGAAVLALGSGKLTERGGRILKLLSGAVMLALGLTMLLRPQWLM
ncbi:MAG: hypothetical protein PWP11_2373 [Thauera sp.]|nr:glutaredoxin family protein [Thauera sp.]MDI3491096.1 hypothetical protein [Thauera sp.]